ncbi:MAG: PhzF family phenazine biosynthesis protein [Rudaea sp.]
MPTFRYLQLDVFPASPGGGNPLGVVIDAQAFSDDAMQRFAAWTNLVETTFLLPPDDGAASYRLRIFTPTKEIPFAGHPSIGSAHAALDTDFAKARDGKLVQQCGAGLLPIRIEGDGAERELFIQAPSAADVSERAADRSALEHALGGRPLGALPPALIEGGRRWWLAEFADENAVRNWKPDHAVIGALAKTDDCLGLCVFARCDHDDYQLVVRAFPAGVDIVEDPASGAANGLIAAWIAMREPDGALARGYRVSQGREMGHDAAITIRFDADRSVWVGGKTRTIKDIQLTWD